MTEVQYQILKIAVEMAVTANLRNGRIHKIAAIRDCLEKMSNDEHSLTYKITDGSAAIFCNNEPQFNISI